MNGQSRFNIYYCKSTHTLVGSIHVELRRCCLHYIIINLSLPWKYLCWHSSLAVSITHRYSTRTLNSKTLGFIFITKIKENSKSSNNNQNRDMEDWLHRESGVFIERVNIWSITADKVYLIRSTNMKILFQYLYWNKLITNPNPIKQATHLLFAPYNMISYFHSPSTKERTLSPVG